MPTTLPNELGFLAPIQTSDLIRVGSSNDGGYVVCKDAIQSADALLSFGISTNWAFEEHFRTLNPSAHIHAYDHTISELHFRRTYQKNLIRFIVGRQTWPLVLKSRATWKSYRSYFPKFATHFEEEVHARYDGPYTATIDKVFSRVHGNRVFLKIDIEGSEYGIIDGILRYAPNITGIAMEFHSTYALRETFCAAIRKLQSAFYIVHIHPNNHGYIANDGLPNTLEVTLNAGLIPENARKRLSLPLIDLDCPNKAGYPEYALNFPE